MASTINASTTLGLVNSADTSGVLQLQTNGTPTVTVDTSGNMGVGIASPAGILHLKGSDPIQYFEDSSGTTSYCSIQNTNGVLDLQADNNATVANSAIKFSVDAVEGMRLTSTGLGIGTSSPAYKLDVNGSGNIIRAINSSTTAAFMLATNSGASSILVMGNEATTAGSSATGSSSYAGLLFTTGTKPLQFGTNSTIQATLDSAGNLGLGVTPSSWASRTVLEVGAAGNAFVSGGAGDVYVTEGCYYNAGWKYGNSLYAPALYNQYRGTHAWLTAASGTAGNAITFTQAMTLDASGNLGVGTTSPTSVSGYKVIETQGSSGGIYQTSASGNTVKARLYSTSSGGFVGTNSNDFFGFITNDTERARIDASGNLLVGTTSQFYSSKLNVYSQGAPLPGSSGIGLGYGTSNGQYRQMYMNNSNQSMYFWNGTNEGYLSSAGAWTNASDARLKNSIVDIKHGLSAVMNTQPRSYKMNDLEGDYIGFVAQELQQVIPEVVSGDPERQLGVDYGSLVAVAFKAIQEQQAIIQQLQADVAALKG